MAICSSDRSLLLDGATRVFVLKGMLLDGLCVPTELPVVNCLSHTPAWIINQILVLLSQSEDRRIWSPSDTLNLAAYQIESLRLCEFAVKESAVKKMRSTKVYQGFEQFIDLALIVDSRTICSDLAENLVMKNGAATFFQHLTAKTAVDFCKRISSGCKFARLTFGSTLGAFFTKLKSSRSREAKSFVSDACNDVFEGLNIDSLQYGICVTYKIPGPSAPSTFHLKWNSRSLCHESVSHYICVNQYSSFEFRTRDSDALIASKTVNNLVQCLGCMQGTGEWLCQQSDASLKVIALSSESASTDEGTVLTSEKRIKDDDGLHSGKDKLRPRPKRVKNFHIPSQRVVYHQTLSDVLKHELWLSLQSVEFNVQTLWNYIKAKESDEASFALKMETRLKSLCLYHADLYCDSRFNEIGSKLISDAKSIRKGFKPTNLQKLLLHFHLIQFGWFLTPVLWNCAELLFLLTTVFDPRLMFCHVVQKDAKLPSEQTQNRGMAACSKFLSSILFERLQEFDLLSTENQCGDAVVLDSNGSYLQHFEAKRTTNYLG